MNKISAYAPNLERPCNSKENKPTEGNSTAKSTSVDMCISRKTRIYKKIVRYVNIFTLESPYSKGFLVRPSY
jgi:hypothetical protein